MTDVDGEARRKPPTAFAAPLWGDPPDTPLDRLVDVLAHIQTGRVWVVDHLARPWSLNAERGGSPWEHRRRTKEWREQVGWSIVASGVPRGLDRIAVVASPWYRGRLADCGNCYPAVKAAVDALVDLRIVPDDDPGHVGPIILDTPRRGRDALTLTIIERPQEPPCPPTPT